MPGMPSFSIGNAVDLRDSLVLIKKKNFTIVAQKPGIFIEADLPR